MRKLILDTSIGIGSIFREIGEICEITKVNDTSLVKELDECNRKLPELAAKLLMKGASVELMDGDGLSVATGWLEEVMKALRTTTYYGHIGHEKRPKNICSNNSRHSEYWEINSAKYYV